MSVYVYPENVLYLPIFFKHLLIFNILAKWKPHVWHRLLFAKIKVFKTVLDIKLWHNWENVSTESPILFQSNCSLKIFINNTFLYFV